MLAALDEHVTMKSVDWKMQRTSIIVTWRNWSTALTCLYNLTGAAEVASPSLMRQFGKFDAKIEIIEYINSCVTLSFYLDPGGQVFSRHRQLQPYGFRAPLLTG